MYKSEDIVLNINFHHFEYDAVLILNKIGIKVEQAISALIANQIN